MGGHDQTTAKGAEADEQIRKRLEFIGMDADERQSLRGIAGVVSGALGPALDDFYSAIAAEPQTVGFFTGSTHMASAKSAQAAHWQIICEGEFNAHYYERARRIGQTHARIGLEPRWYVAGYSIVTERLVDALVDARRFSSRRRLKAELKALVKAVLLDMEIALSVYQESADAEIAGKIGAGLARLADGDLTARIANVDKRFSRLQDDFNRAAAELESSFAAVATASEGVRAAAGEIRSASEDLGNRAERQAGSLEEAAASLREVTDRLAESACNAANAVTATQSARNEVSEGQEVVRNAIDTVNRIERGSHEINKIVDLIDGIAFQTNLLALNAGVEAARAGETGKGFAVVANEVRALAQRSADAASEIRSLIQSNSVQVEKGVSMVTRAGDMLSGIVTRVDGINALISEIAGAARAQSDNLAAVNGAVSEMDRTTQQNAAMAEQSSAASHSLSEEANRLADLISRFATGTGGSRQPALRAA